MIHNEVKPARGNGTGFGICAATTLCSPESTPLPFSGQVPSRAVLWLAHCARISMEHAAALAEANHLGGV